MPKLRSLPSLPTISELEPDIQERGETNKDDRMSSTSNLSESSRSSSDTDQTVTVSTRAQEDGKISVANDSASELSESLLSLSREIGSSANSAVSDDEFTGLQTNVVPPSSDTASDDNSRATSLASSHATLRRGTNDSRGSGFQTGEDAQKLTVRPANAAQGGLSRGESSRAGREQIRRARAQERVQSYLSEVSHAAVLTNFEEDMGIPVPPSPPRPPFLDTIIPRVWWMRVLFWVMLAVIIFMSPIYIWVVRALLGRT